MPDKRGGVQELSFPANGRPQGGTGARRDARKTEEKVMR